MPFMLTQIAAVRERWEVEWELDASTENERLNQNQRHRSNMPL